MSAQPVMVIPPKAVSRLFGACVNAAEGADCPSLFDFGANFTIRTGNKYMNWANRNGVLVDLPDGEAAREKRQREFDDYITATWLSRMSEEYQRAYEELMQTLDEARSYYAGAKEDVTKCIKKAQKEIEALRPHAVTINGKTFWIGSHGEFIDDNGNVLDESNTRKEDLEEARRRYAADPDKARQAALGGGWVDSLKRALRLADKIASADADAAASQKAAQKGGMSETELKGKNDETAVTKEEMEAELKALQQDTPLTNNALHKLEISPPLEAKGVNVNNGVDPATILALTQKYNKTSSDLPINNNLSKTNIMPQDNEVKGSNRLGSIQNILQN